MFCLSVIEDEVALAASSLRPGRHIDALREVIEEKFIDKVIPSVGLVIALYDLLSVKDKQRVMTALVFLTCTLPHVPEVPLCRNTL